MSHTFNLFNIRAFGYGVCKAMEKLFDGIYVNDEQLVKIRERSKKDCVVFMPSHKTYFDFLLLSVICFQYDIQLPAIAAGQDFMSMKFMAGVLRRSGAFFMRRSFGTDQLYWAVFSEYVQNHVVNNDRTVEFFVEATRSRVGKSLHPKYGVLQMVLEPYLRGTVFDIVIVPVSISYDKILEEKLYAYELLGFPKPKESTGGLFKAREVLNRKHGSCFMTFGDPISVRDYFGKSLHRGTFVCQPDSQFVLDVQAKNEIKKFAHRVVEIHNQNAVITVWSVACMVILQTFDHNDQATLSYSGVYTRVEDLIKLLNRLGATVNIDTSLDKSLRYYLKLHDDLFEPFDIEADDFQLMFIDFPVAHQKPEVPKAVMERAISRLILTTYSNGMIHAVDSEGILCQIVSNTEKCHVASAKEEFCWLHTLMKREFVIIPGELSELFDKTIEILTDSKIVKLSDSDPTVLEIVDRREAEQLGKLVLPYFYNFEMTFNTFDVNRPMISNLSEIVPTVQKNISDAYQNGLPNARLSFLSTEPIKNAFSALVDFGAFEKTSTGIRPNFPKLHQIRSRLSKFTNLSTTSKL
uniref:PlsC domain-containing protein n=1 Tax=Caenorhabditis japonica TaxID=281687 RepID=A0A8R1I0I0_CAEJA